MPTDEITLNGNSSTTIPSGQLSSQASSGNPVQEFRFGSEAPEWARGKSATEVLNLASTMHQALATLQTPAASISTQAPVLGLPTDDDFLSRPGEATRRVAEATFAEKLSPALSAMQTMATQIASSQRMLAETKFAEEFRRWGPEIDTLMASVAPEQRTFDNYAKVVTFVQGQHWRELAGEEAKRLVAQGGLGERSNGGGTAPPATSGLDLTKLPAGLAQVAQRVGLTESMVLDFCKANGWKPEEWMAAALDNKVITSTGPFANEFNPSALGVSRGFDS